MCNKRKPVVLEEYDFQRVAVHQLPFVLLSEERGEKEQHCNFLDFNCSLNARLLTWVELWNRATLEVGL